MYLCPDIFLGDEIGYFSGWFGIYDKWWTHGPDGEILRLIRKTVDGKPQYYGGPGITGGNLEGTEWTLKNKGYRLEGDTPQTYGDRMAYYNALAENFAAGVANGLLYKYPHPWSEPNSETYLEINADIKRVFDEMVAAVQATFKKKGTPRRAAAERKIRLANAKL